MCVIPDEAATARFRARKSVQRGYKVLRKEDARPVYFVRSRASYRPGHNADRYAARSLSGYRKTHHGLHCYLNRKYAEEDAKAPDAFYTVVAVTFKPADVIVAEKANSCPGRQIVVRALHISARAWKQAGLPAKVKGGGA